jgi:salicylate synthase
MANASHRHPLERPQRRQHREHDQHEDEGERHDARRPSTGSTTCPVHDDLVVDAELVDVDLEPERPARHVPRLERSAVVGAPDDPAEAAVRPVRAPGQDEHAVYERAGTWHVGTAPAATLTAHPARVVARAGGQTWELPTHGRPLQAVADALAALPPDGWRAFGWATFELGHLLHTDLQGTGPAPLLHLVLPSAEAEPTPGKARLRATGDTWTAGAADLLARPAARTPTGPAADPEALIADDPARYRQTVATTIADIRAGRLQKAVLSRALPLPTDTGLDIASTYLAGRRANSPARSYLLDLGGWPAAGFSPETVVEVDAEGRVSTQPLAGTRALGVDPVANRRLRDELLADPKEIHEHAVSVRLACDELSGICREGSVVVEEFMNVSERGSVQHLASRVTGRLREGASGWDAFAALFPAVTVTGVPREAAMRAIHRHENGPRGLYGGSVFVAGADGSLDAALVLRSVFRQDGRTWLRAGAGITGQSTPEREWEETCEKLRSVAPHLRVAVEDPPTAR